MRDKDVFSHVSLGEDNVAFLKKLAADLPILADICRADLLLYCAKGGEKAVAVAQAMPHSVSPLYQEKRLGLIVGPSEQQEVLRTLGGKLSPTQVHTVAVRGATVARQVFPVWNAQGKLIAAMAMDSYWLAHERQLRRSRAFQDALRDLRTMVLRGELRGAESLAPFGEHDGILYVNAERIIRYMSGVAASLYRHLGYRDSLIGRRVSELETVDPYLVTQALAEQRCFERQDEQYGRTWVRRALPVSAPDEPFWGLLSGWRQVARDRPSRSRGVLILIHDATETLQAQRELESKMALIREVHHRVKNNLQIIASLMRLQARRVSSAEAKAVLEESVNRILSVAVVHEFLSQNAKGMINLLEVAHRILTQVQQALIDPRKRIQLRVKGSDIWLPAERATHCALVINELVQNAIEHGMAHRDEGFVDVELVDRGEEVNIVVTDNGEGLPTGFAIETNANLGLRIVRSMVERDLKGQFELRGDEHGTRAVVHFSKSALGGG